VRGCAQFQSMHLKSPLLGALSHWFHVPSNMAFRGRENIHMYIFDRFEDSGTETLAREGALGV
jgi:hypothetical protein